MMQNKILLFLCLITFFASCETSKENSATQNQLNFEESFIKVGEVTFNEVILGGTIRIQEYQDGYLIMDTDRERLEWFTSAGEHVKTIGNEGRGPGEFERLQAFTVDTSNNIFAFDASSMRFSIFNSNGEYKTSFILEESFRAHELKFWNDKLFAFRGYTHEGMPMYISEINPENGKIINEFFSPPPLLDKLDIPVSGHFQNMNISDEIISVVHPLLFQIYQYGLDGNLIRKVEGSSSAYKKPDPDYKVPAPLHDGISAIIQTNFTYNDINVIGLSEVKSKGSGDYYIELFDKAGRKINENSINTGNKYLLYVNSNGRYYFRKAEGNKTNYTTLEIFELSPSINKEI